MSCKNADRLLLSSTLHLSSLNLYAFFIPILVTLSILFLLFMARHGGIPLPSRGKVGKNRSTQSKTTSFDFQLQAIHIHYFNINQNSI